ncbi:MAG: hypothetical protein AAGD09_06250 [Cyanobacteria bacterium P01_F01_bin.56]
MHMLILKLPIASETLKSESLILGAEKGQGEMGEMPVVTLPKNREPKPVEASSSEVNTVAVSLPELNPLPPQSGFVQPPLNLALAPPILTETFPPPPVMTTSEHSDNSAASNPSPVEFLPPSEPPLVETETNVAEPLEHTTDVNEITEVFVEAGNSPTEVSTAVTDQDEWSVAIADIQASVNQLKAAGIIAHEAPTGTQLFEQVALSQISAFFRDEQTPKSGLKEYYLIPNQLPPQAESEILGPMLMATGFKLNPMSQYGGGPLYQITREAEFTHFVSLIPIRNPDSQSIDTLMLVWEQSPI